MNILIVNDDGIASDGILRLARAAKEFGKVYVVGPARQCSGMSMKLTIYEEIELKPYDFPIEVAGAWCLDGTPVDCVKIARSELLPEEPDWVFSGVNNGYNTGCDLLYSGTFGAATEAVLNGIPAAAFSAAYDAPREVVDANLTKVIAELLSRPIDLSAAWNVNFPGCAPSELKGIRWDVEPAHIQLYTDHITRRTAPDGRVFLTQGGIPIGRELAPEGSDAHAVLHNYIAIGKVRNLVTL